MCVCVFQEMDGITAALAEELFYKGWFPSFGLLAAHSRVSVEEALPYALVPVGLI